MMLSHRDDVRCPPLFCRPLWQPADAPLGSSSVVSVKEGRKALGVRAFRRTQACLVKSLFQLTRPVRSGQAAHGT